MVDEVNRQTLQSMAKQGQTDSSSLQTDLETAITKTQALRQTVPAGDVKTATQAADLEKDLTDVHANLTTFRSLSSGILVSPFSAKIIGLSQGILTVTGFFAPAVIVLLLQHVSITFSSLSIVREKHSGIMELFRVAPIKAFETLVGKYLSYLFFETILAGVITGLAVWLLRIPILGRLQDYALAVVILLFTSLGVGFFISLISQTDTQAVQYSMLLMLASIFFSGFFSGPAFDEGTHHSYCMVITCHVRHSNVAGHYVTRICSASATIYGSGGHRNRALPDQLDTPEKNNGKSILLNVICGSFHRIADPIYRAPVLGLARFCMRPPTQPHCRLFPQVVERNLPRSMDAAGVFGLYDEYMTRVYQ
ncbi:MAG TPA: ABC transporter permease [Anaerolineales bacterium]|nr:ABC transporter permease [Anaerolineales bacterium]